VGKLHLAKHIEDLPTERFALLIELLEQTQIDLALARLVGDQVPEMAYLGLSDAWMRRKRCSKWFGFDGRS